MGDEIDLSFWMLFTLDQAIEGFRIELSGGKRFYLTTRVAPHRLDLPSKELEFSSLLSA